MIDPFVLVGLKDPAGLHSLFVQREKNGERGIFVLEIEILENSKIPKLRKVLRVGLEDFKIENNSNDEIVKNEAIKQSVRHYDRSYQYCLMFEVHDEIVGGCFVPFDSPNELQLAIDQALLPYLN